MLSIAASLLLVGCVDYSINDPDDDVVIPTVVEDTFVQAPLPKLDVLFVVDGTRSMAQEQASFADAADVFVRVLEDLELAYQIGVTSADPDDDGALLGRPWIITSAALDPSDALANALEVGVDSASPPAGLYAASRALLDVQGVNRGFRRPDAGLHVVFISDGDDESDEWLGADPAAAFRSVLQADAAASGRAARASAIVGDVPDGCTGESGTAQAGERYAEVALTTGGNIASICSADFEAIASDLGGAAVEWPTTFTLSRTPVEATVLVEIDGQRVTEGWTVNPVAPSIVFDEAPAADVEISVAYTVAVEEP